MVPDPVLTKNSYPTQKNQKKLTAFCPEGRAFEEPTILEGENREDWAFDDDLPLRGQQHVANVAFWFWGRGQ